jgi:hypothetical protein
LRNIGVVVVFVCGLVMLSAAAGGATATQTTSAGPSTPNNAPSDCPQDQPITGSAEDYACARFTDPTRIDNSWLPLTPGTRFVYRGSAIVEGEGRQARRVVTTVTDLAKVIDGVRTLVVFENDYTAGQLSETELAFFAQDDVGNVWLLGEYPEEYEDGEFADAPFWIAGLRRARAGIAMLADPQVGAPDYAMGFAPPPADFRDRARVAMMGQQTCVPVGCYEDVLVTEEFEQGVPRAFQLKYYAPSIGLVRVGWRGAEEEERETLRLVGYQHLSPKALATARQAAKELDQRGRKRSMVYRQTPPVKSHKAVR